MGIKVDLGCGRNKRDNPDAVGVDLNNSLNPDIVADITKRIDKLVSGCASFVSCNHVLEHLTEGYWLKVVQEIARLLETGGTFQITVPHPSHDSAMIYGHIHVLIPQWWKEHQEANSLQPLVINNIVEVPNKIVEKFCLIKGLIFEEWGTVLRNSYIETKITGTKL